MATLGDSITKGTGYPYGANTSYPEILQNILGHSFDVRNFGLPGSTVAPSSFYNSSEYHKAQSVDADVYIFMFGTNDAKKSNNWKNFENNFCFLINSFSNESMKLIMIPPPSYRDARYGIDQSYVNKHLPVKIEAVSKETKTTLIDVFSLFQVHCPISRGVMGEHTKSMNTVMCDWISFNGGDAIHPNNDGYLAIARMVASSLMRKMHLLTKNKLFS